MFTLAYGRSANASVGAGDTPYSKLAASFAVGQQTSCLSLITVLESRRLGTRLPRLRTEFFRLFCMLLDATDVDIVESVKSDSLDGFDLLNRRLQNDLFSGDGLLLKRYCPEDEIESQALPIDSTSSICFLDAPMTCRTP